MQLAAVVLARVLAYVEAADLNPRGTVYFPVLMRKLVDKFGFQKFPTTYEQTNEDKGIEFFEGRWNDVTVDKLAIFKGALVLDTSASTADSERIIEEALVWAATECGLNYRPGMIARKQYLSDVTFYSDVKLEALHPAVFRLQKSVSENASSAFKQALDFRVTQFVLDFDKTKTPLVTAPFSIQRRGNSHFTENKYFSEAPLPTEVHLKILEQFEADLIAQ
jgi:hypothetical protein